MTNAKFLARSQFVARAIDFLDSFARRALRVSLLSKGGVIGLVVGELVNCRRVPAAEEKKKKKETYDTKHQTKT